MTHEDKKKEKEKIWKMGTWNVRSLTGKENELIGELENIDIDILGITETKKKGKGEIMTEGGHIMMYSGVDLNYRAKEGVGCIVNKDNIRHIRKWYGISERILKVELEIDEKDTTVIVAYGPNEDETVAKKDKFWEQLSDIAEEAKGRLIILGDLNARVGTRDEETAETIGIHGEKVRNSNGRRLIDFCILNNLIITNTFYAHKDIHKYTREVRSRGEKSIIDYVIINREFRGEIKDTKVRRGAELYSDHFLVLSKVKIVERKRGRGSGIVRDRKNKSKSKEVTKTYKLREEEIARNYREAVEIEMERIGRVGDSTSLENLWKDIRDTVINVARKKCGCVSMDSTRKQTKWWNEEIRREIKLKKQKWRMYLSNKNSETYHVYKEQRVRVRELVKEAKQRSWAEFGEKMEQDSHGNQKLFYKVLKTLRKGKCDRSKFVKSKSGEMLCEDEDIMTRWREYFEDVLNNEQSNQGDVVETEKGERGDEEEYSEHDEIKMNEVQDAIRMLKRGKAAGHDEITPEMLKNLGRNGVELLTSLFNKAWKEKRIPKDWELGIILPIHKKGDNRECSNYRGISILSVVLKVYESILGKRLKTVIESQLEEPQSGFRKGRGIQDHIFTIKQLIEKNLNSGVFIAFLDLEKAFDSIPREVVWRSLSERGVDRRLIDCIASIYKTTRNYVRTGNLKSREFVTKEGLRQGGVLSPTLFNIVMDNVIKDTKKKIKKLRVGYRNMKMMEISTCAFADDLAIFAESEQDLRYNLETWKRALQDQGLKINIDKTKVMVMGKEDLKVSILLDGKIVEQVETFTYLGVKIHSNGEMEAEINARIENTMKLYHAMNNTFIRRKEISPKTKMTVYNTIYKPILTYGSESWILTKQMKSKIQATEMKYLRGVQGITRRDKIRNEKVREELRVEPVLKSIERQQLRWLGHMFRMDDERQVKKIWQARTMQKRGRGRPKKSWNEVLAERLKERGLSWIEGKRMATNRREWAKFVYG